MLEVQILLLLKVVVFIWEKSTWNHGTPSTIGSTCNSSTESIDIFQLQVASNSYLFCCFPTNLQPNVFFRLLLQSLLTQRKHRFMNNPEVTSPAHLIGKNRWPIRFQAIYIATFPRPGTVTPKRQLERREIPQICAKGSDFKGFIISNRPHVIFVVEDRLALQQDFLSASSVGRILALCSQEELPGQVVGSARFGGAFQIDGLGKISAKMRFGKLKKHFFTIIVYIYILCFVVPEK